MHIVDNCNVYVQSSAPIDVSENPNIIPTRPARHHHEASPLALAGLALGDIQSGVGSSDHRVNQKLSPIVQTGTHV